jgi:hypothetical protein
MDEVFGSQSQIKQTTKRTVTAYEEGPVRRIGSTVPIRLQNDFEQVVLRDIERKENHMTAMNKYFSDSIGIFAVALGVGFLAIIELVMGFSNLSLLLIQDALNSLIFAFVLLSSYFSIIFARNTIRDNSFNYGYTRVTVAATFVNSVYMIFFFLFELSRVTHEILEGFGGHAEEESVHHTGEFYIYLGTRLNGIRLALYIIIIFWTLKEVSVVQKLEDMIVSAYPKYERRFQVDDEGYYYNDIQLKNCSLLYFSLKVMFIYELIESVSTIWAM